MSLRIKGVIAVVITGLMAMWVGWNAHSQGGNSFVTLAAAVAASIGLAGVGCWMAAWGSKSEFSLRMKTLVAHLESLRERGDYGRHHELEGDDEVARAADQIDSMLQVVVHRLDEAGQGRRTAETRLAELEAELSRCREKLQEVRSHRERLEQAQRKALADVEHRVRERTEELCRANDTLVEEVSQRTLAESALRQLHLELEERVKERTFELALANEMLVKEIEDRRQAEGERQKLVSLVENASDFIALASLDGQITFLNESGRRLLGLDHPSQAVGLRVDLFEGAASQGAFAGIILKAVVSSGSWTGEMELCERTAAARTITAEVNALLVRQHEDSRPLCIALVIRDITDRRNAERALKELEERFSKAFHASPAGVAIVTLDEGRFVDVNSSFLQSLGYERSEVVGRSTRDLHLWASEEARDALLQALQQQSSLRDHRCKWQAKSGEPRDVELAVEPMVLGREKCLLVVAEDITDRLRLEDQLRQSTKMDAVGQLAAGIAHDFNNILTVVQGHAALLMNEGSLPSQSSNSIQCVSSAADRAAKLTRQLLTFSRKQVVQWKELDLNKVIQNLSGMLRSLITENISIAFHYHDGIPLVRGDANMLEQILLNLVVNARDAMPKGGTLVIDTSVQEVDADVVRRNPRAKAGRFACFTVMDTGCGMDAATLERIFEPFFTTKEFGQGTGLGLATVYGVVTQHNGWIDVTSSLGHGTLFRIYIPAIAAQPPRREEASPDTKPEVRGGTETVLVVEDELGLRMLVEAVLQKHGYKVLLAEHGVEALRLWETHKGQIHLLLTDMVMPEGVTGLELSERLRVEKPELRVVYMSGYSVDFMENDMTGIDEGSNFLQKPYRPEQLVRAVRQVLDIPSQPLPRRSSSPVSSLPAPDSASKAA